MAFKLALIEIYKGFAIEDTFLGLNNVSNNAVISVDNKIFFKKGLKLNDTDIDVRRTIKKAWYKYSQLNHPDKFADNLDE